MKTKPVPKTPKRTYLQLIQQDTRIIEDRSGYLPPLMAVAVLVVFLQVLLLLRLESLHRKADRLPAATREAICGATSSFVLPPLHLDEESPKEKEWDALAERRQRELEKELEVPRPTH